MIGPQAWNPAWKNSSTNSGRSLKACIHEYLPDRIPLFRQDIHGKSTFKASQTLDTDLLGIDTFGRKILEHTQKGNT
jgi:hypothetical protein